MLKANLTLSCSALGFSFLAFAICVVNSFTIRETAKVGAETAVVGAETAKNAANTQVMLSEHLRACRMAKRSGERPVIVLRGKEAFIPMVAELAESIERSTGSFVVTYPAVESGGDNIELFVVNVPEGATISDELMVADLRRIKAKYGID